VVAARPFPFESGKSSWIRLFAHFLSFYLLGKWPVSRELARCFLANNYYPLRENMLF
jgi:hypothetical protein